MALEIFLFVMGTKRESDYFFMLKCSEITVCNAVAVSLFDIPRDVTTGMTGVLFSTFQRGF